MKETIITLAVFFFIFVFIVAFEFILVGEMAKKQTESAPIELPEIQLDEK
tara:strand:- start:459 stop:608 length:150 start_codon:yes stop_codon:yes gene_type:complete